jgi:hypothetical protein
MVNDGRRARPSGWTGVRLRIRKIGRTTPQSILRAAGPHDLDRRTTGRRCGTAPGPPAPRRFSLIERRKTLETIVNWSPEGSRGAALGGALITAIAAYFSTRTASSRNATIHAGLLGFHAKTKLAISFCELILFLKNRSAIPKNSFGVTIGRGLSSFFLRLTDRA